MVLFLKESVYKTGSGIVITYIGIIVLFYLCISFGYADVLKTKYKGLADYRQFGELAATDLTEKSLKIGSFFSISYNLGGTGH